MREGDSEIFINNKVGCLRVDPVSMGLGIITSFKPLVA